jgi:hypothetical protein
MYFVSFGAGALAGAVLLDRRMIFAVITAASALVFIGVRDRLFENWFSGTLWFLVNLACFELGLVLAGFAIVVLRQHLRHRFGHAGVILRADEN